MSGESWNNGRSPFMPRKSLDIRFSEYPLDQGKEPVPFPAFPARAKGSRDWSLAGT